MKKQINPTIKAHLIRSAFYVLLLLAVCVIPFALAQRNTPKRSAATKPKAAATKVAANKAQLAAQLERAKSVPASLIGKRQLAPQRKSASAHAQLRYDLPAVPWTLAAPVAIDHYGGFMDSDGTFAYEGGGYSFSAPGTINQFGRFDPVANTWTPLAAVPDLINAEASGVYAPNVNKLFVFGGDDPDSGTVVNTTRIYDIATDTWTSGAPLPDVRAFMGSGYFNGKIYLVGGYSTGNVDPSFGQVWEYDPIANTFDTSRASMPATLGGPGFGIINGHIYIAGGRDINNTNLNTLYDYDIVANTWTQRANLPTGMNVPGSAVIGGQLWVFGGGNPFLGSGTSPKSSKKAVFAPDTSNILQVYDPVADTWTSGPNLNHLRAFPAGTHVGNTAVAVGGYDGTGSIALVEINGATGGGTPTPTPTGTPGGNCSDYTFALGTATFVPGVDDIGLDCDDCGLDVVLPFTVHLYDQDFTQVHVGSNGHATFGTFDDGFGITCSPFGIAGTTYALAPFWDDQTAFAADGHGAFTTTTGVSPNRIFYIEWRTFYFGEADQLNYEVAFFEDGSLPFQYIYNTITPSTIPNPFSQLVIGSKKDDSNFSVFGCDPSGGQAPPVASGDALTPTCVAGGGSPTPTPTGTPSGCVVSGSIDTGDPTQTDRLFRSGVPQTCPPTTTCATFGDGLPHHYDEYTFTNTTGSTQCVTVDTDTACTGTNFIFIASYLGSFDPANICTNWIGDSGSSPDIGVPAPFQFNLDDGQTVVIVVSEVTPDAGCAGYTVTVSGICGGGGTPTPTPTCIPGSPNGAAGPWTAGTAYPTTIVRYGFVQTATHFYVFGGVDNGSTTSAVNRMDLSTGNWEPRAAMPFSGEGPTCALDTTTGIAYCADGFATNAFAAYDTNTDTWTPLAPDPFVTDHFGSASGTFNGKVYVVGGTGAFSNATWIYDIASNSWSLGTSAPTGPFEFAGYQQVGQFLYLVGGYDPTFVNLTTSLRLDMSSAPGTWDTGPTFTPQLADFGLAYDAGTNTLYSLGGDLGNDGNPFNSTNQVNELDVSGWPGGTWNPSPPDLPAPNRQASQAGFFGNGDIWCVGGINGATFQFLNEVWHRNNGGGVCPSPTATVTPPSPTPTATSTITPPTTATPTATATITPPPSATPTATLTPSPSPTRPPPTPRPRPTPFPRPTP